MHSEICEQHVSTDCAGIWQYPIIAILGLPQADRNHINQANTRSTTCKPTSNLYTESILETLQYRNGRMLLVRCRALSGCDTLVHKHNC